jgi:hypothetical protein
VVESGGWFFTATNASGRHCEQPAHPCRWHARRRVKSPGDTDRVVPPAGEKGGGGGGGGDGDGGGGVRLRSLAADRRGRSSSSAASMESRESCATRLSSLLSASTSDCRNKTQGRISEVARRVQPGYICACLVTFTHSRCSSSHLS